MVLVWFVWRYARAGWVFHYVDCFGALRARYCGLKHVHIDEMLGLPCKVHRLLRQTFLV